MSGKSMGSHQSAKMKTGEWITPPEIMEALGPFDLDPCAPINRPWDTATNHYTIEDNGLIMPWKGRVWCNPPYGMEATEWLKLLADHRNGTALIFARTETAMFFKHVWPKAESLLFLKGRLHFHYVDGTRAISNAGAPSVLVAYNEANAQFLDESGLAGKHIPLTAPYYIIGRQKKTVLWREIVAEAIDQLGGEGSVADIYDAVVELAPHKSTKNAHVRQKVRQTLQRNFTRVAPAVYK